VRDIDTAAADSLEVLDPKRPIREATKLLHYGIRHDNGIRRNCEVSRPISGIRPAA